MCVIDNLWDNNVCVTVIIIIIIIIVSVYINLYTNSYTFDIEIKSLYLSFQEMESGVRERKV